MGRLGQAGLAGPLRVQAGRVQVRLLGTELLQAGLAAAALVQAGLPCRA